MVTQRVLVSAALATLSLAALSLVLSAALEAQQPPEAEKRYRVESIRIDPVGRTLTWAVSEGRSDEDGSYPALMTLLPDYRIDLRHATMTWENETRRFSRDEAEVVAEILAVVVQYANESTVWWELGKGEPVDPKSRASLNGALRVESHGVGTVPGTTARVVEGLGRIEALEVRARAAQ